MSTEELLERIERKVDLLGGDTIPQQLLELIPDQQWDLFIPLMVSGGGHTLRFHVRKWSGRLELHAVVNGVERVWSRTLLAAPGVVT